MPHIFGLRTIFHEPPPSTGRTDVRNFYYYYECVTPDTFSAESSDGSGEVDCPIFFCSGDKPVGERKVMLSLDRGTSTSSRKEVAIRTVGQRSNLRGNKNMAPSDHQIYMTPKEVMNDPLGALASAAIAAEASEASCSDNSRDLANEKSVQSPQPTRWVMMSE